MNEGDFKLQYKKLNPAQREAVETIEGPVMVVAGPGTGKTQILSLRIANILEKTDTKADSILCLTFTNSGVRAMRERLRAYIGGEAGKVNVSTFHSFASSIIDEHYGVLGFSEAPELLDDKQKVVLYDRLLESKDWKYIKPRSHTSRYFKDLMSLISILKRERITPEQLVEFLKQEVEELKNDENNISSRGITKGQLKKEVQNKIESLEKTLEATEFYALYEEEKLSGEKVLFDYDDVLEGLVKIIEESEEVCDALREGYQYILVDEHQDSSGIQNEFLEGVWAEVEKPNIFVVGDDRQLIYGFGGASLEYFENFKHSFGKAKLITLVENYRSTQKILDSAHELLKSSITPEKLKSNKKENHPIRLIEATYQRDEIIAAGLEIKKLTDSGEIDINDVALLVPKNFQARSAIIILEDLGLPVVKEEKVNLFGLEETQSFLNVLRVLADPTDDVAFSRTLFSPLTDIPQLDAYKYVKGSNMRDFSLLTKLGEKKESNNQTLFVDDDKVGIWIEKLGRWLENVNNMSVYSFIQQVGQGFLIDPVSEHKDLVVRIEVIRTLLHLVLMLEERGEKATLPKFLKFIDKIEEYGENIPLAVLAGGEGVRVLTLHGSKGLEFDFVWIAHVDEGSLRGRRRGGFALPEVVKKRIEERDEKTIRRELYVAITRAKKHCTLSYASHSYTGGGLKLSPILEELSGFFEIENKEVTDKKIMDAGPEFYVQRKEKQEKNTTLEELTKLVANDYENRKVSVSLLNNFFECPWKWYFRNLIQLPEKVGNSLIFGNMVHNSIDRILKLEDRRVKKEEIEKIVNSEYLRNIDVENESLKKEALSVVTRWVDERLGEIEKKYENEKSIALRDEKFSHLSVYGKIDLVEMLGEGKVRVTDFKTGKARRKSDIEKVDDEGRMSDYMRQLAMYAYLLSESPKWKKDVEEVRLEFVESTDKKNYYYSTQVNEEQIDLLKRDIEDYDKLVSSGAWTSRPCNFKSYGRSNAVCEYCKLARIYKKD
jgi:DNA helicase-2/ATP-dependent DNA helicase PcrA